MLYPAHLILASVSEPTRSPANFGCLIFFKSLYYKEFRGDIVIFNLDSDIEYF